MKQIKLVLLTAAVLGFATACKEQLDVKNPNSPTPQSASSESGLISLAQGGVYIDGFRQGTKFTNADNYDGVLGYFWAGVITFHDAMGDEVGVEAANEYLNQIGAPDYVILDDGTKVLNPNAPNQQIALIRAINKNANAGNNPLYYEWAYMYSMNSAMNNVLALADAASFTGDAATKKNTIKAWAYFWKGFAYSRIGSMYYAGIINDATTGTNGNYVTKEKIIDEANANYDKATAALTAATNAGDYTTVLTNLLPSFTQTGKGAIPSVDMWKRNINTMKARNILVNTPTKTMTNAQWTSILALTNDGVKAADNVFTGRANDNGDVWSATDGTLAIRVVGDPASVGQKVSERLIQDFRPGDKRLENNFNQVTTWIGNADRGNSFNTRWALVNGGKGLPGVVSIGARSNAYELYLAGTYEENELMKAEAKIYTGDVAGGLASIDAVRKAQGAGLAPLSGLTADAAKEELRSERRVALAFRGFSFYDARRMGILDDVSKGGGRKGAVVVDNKGKVNTNATINYNFLDYWDVPDNELAYNPAVSGAPVKNPKQ